VSENLSLNEVVDRLLGVDDEKKEIITVMSYTKKFLREQIENSDKREGTKKNYRNAVNQFTIFLQLKDWQNMPIEKFKSEHANAFKKFLETPNESLGSIGIDVKLCNQLYVSHVRLNGQKKSLKEKNSTISSSTKIKNLNPIFEKAIEEDLIYKNPFGKIKLNFVGDEAPELTPSMLKRVFDFKPASGGLEFTKDIFLFMCFTGFAYIDAINLSSKEFEIVNGEIHLLSVNVRRKTGCRIRQILCDEATKIVFKYLKFGMFGDKVFPHESSESLNRKLKIIQNIVQIPFDLTTKNGRVTFKKILVDGLIQNKAISRKMMGWGKPRSIEELYDRYNEAEFRTAKLEIDSYLNTILNCEKLIVSA